MIGVVLAGGRSTRLGQDKVRLRLPGDGRDMLARTADLLEVDPGVPLLGDMAGELAAVDPARFTTTSRLQEVS